MLFFWSESYMLLSESNHGDTGVGRDCYFSKKIQEIKVPQGHL